MWKLAQKSNEHVRHSKRGNILGDSSGMARANQTTIRPRKNTLYKRLRQFGDMLNEPTIRAQTSERPVAN